VFKADEMAALITAVDQKFAAIGKNNLQFAGKKALLLAGTFYQDSVRVTEAGWRTDFLTNMGFIIPDTGGELIPRNKIATVLDDADVLIWTTESDDEQAALLADPIVVKLRATTLNRNVFTGKDLSGAIAFASTLSYPVVADQLPPLLTKALA
jgi:iron complex transport system substrate-binding protein